MQHDLKYTNFYFFQNFSTNKTILKQQNSIEDDNTDFNLDLLWERG